MEIDKALTQISEIHEHVARAEVYRDFKAVPMICSGLLALAAAWLQPRFPAAASGNSFILFWLSVASICAAWGAGGIARNYLWHSNALARRRTRTVVGQFVPCLAAGFIVTITALANPHLPVFLPGLWAILFGLGVFAARPYLPRMIGYAALFYLGAGGVLLALAPSGASLNPLGMGLVFGIGQMLTGAILYWNLERGKEGRDGS